MWALLLGGHGFIVVCYVWVWGLAATMARCVSAERWDRLTRADAQTVAVIMAVWTLLWALLSALDAWT